MAGGRERADAYHQQFAERIIQALKEGTAPWQKPWKPGERIMPHNFGSGRDYRGGNAVYLAMNALRRGYADPRWGGYRQIQEAGGHVRKGEKGTPIMYVEWRQQRTARDDKGNPVLDNEGRKKLEWVQRDRPIVKLHHVFNVEQTDGLKLRSLAKAVPEWEGHERAEALIRASGVRVDHVAGDRAYYSLKDDRVVLPDRSQFESHSAYTHTALHELGHATGQPDRLNRPTLVRHGGFGSEAYAREELRAEIAAMMDRRAARRRARAAARHRVRQLLDQGPGERPARDPRRGRRRAADLGVAAGALARERERSLGDEKAAPERPGAGDGRTREPAAPEPAQPLPPRMSHEASPREDRSPPRAFHPTAAEGRPQRDSGPNR